MTKRKILIFSVSFGNGHNQVANVLFKHLSDCDTDVEVVDTFECINSTFHKLILTSYLKLLQYKPSLWGKLYQYSEEYPDSILLQQFIDIITRKVFRYLQKKQPDTIITTHPIATNIMAHVIEKKSLPIQLYALLTDFALHPLSIHSHVRGYFVPSKHLSFYVYLYNLKPNSLLATGIPLIKENIIYYSKKEMQCLLHLSTNVKTVLIAGGGVGFAKFTKIIHVLERCHEKLQIICVTANNKRAEQKLKQIESKHDIRVLGFTNLFMEYLRASDVIITKAGGVTMAEALLCETPVLIFQPLPGQEEQNSQFMMNYGAAIKAEIVEEIPVLLEEIIFNPQYHTMMVENAKKLQHPFAAKKITEIIKENATCTTLIRKCNK